MGRTSGTSGFSSFSHESHPTVLILIDGERDRELLRSQLEKDLDVAVGPAGLAEEDVALIIADRRNLSHHWDELVGRRASSDELFLPVLLLSKETEQIDSSSRLWKVVDEVIQIPARRRQLNLRVKMLLRARKYSQISAHRYNRLRDQVEAVERQKEEYERLFLTSHDPIFLIQEEGSILKANPAAHRLVGCQEGALRGQSFSEFFCDPDRADDLCLLLQEEGSLDDVEAEMQRRDESVFIGNISASMYAHHTENGDESACQFIIRDISDTKAYEQQLIEARETAEEMNRLKSAFLANMSHEIRTPLASIIGYADLLDQQVPQELQPSVEVIHSSGQRLLRTLDSVLTLAKLQSGSMELRVEDVDVGELVHETIRDLRIEAERKELHFEFNEPDEPLVGRLDQDALVRIVSHLGHNAVKFTHEGAVEIDLETPDETGFVLTITDTGIGIDEATVPQLFEAFRQASTGRAREYEGSGLGLTLTRELVDLLDGSIAVSSEPGEGTTFRITIPWARSDREEDSRTLHSAHEWGLNALPPNQRVLIVDDDPAVRGLIVEMLPASYEVDTAKRADEAISLTQEHAYDIVLLDINLRDSVNGVDIHRRFRQDKLLEDALIVAITAYAQTGDGEHFHELGFDGYVPKPFTRDVLYDNLVQVMV